MSYDIGLYEKQFLKRALEENLGDWTIADRIPMKKYEWVKQRLLQKGYLTEDYDVFAHPNPKWGVQIHFFEGEIAFVIAYWADAESAIATVMADAIELAREADLGFCDPQKGEVLF